MAYIRIPTSNTSRNENELRSAIDQLTAAIARLEHITAKMSQMTTDADLQAEYNLVSVGDAGTVRSITTSATAELTDPAQTPFTQQLVEVMG